ncbi:MAG TPA: SHOCT domain-containing protein, partial [Acidobacteriota bacterium]|nr:SHOCT domain-containing protein [Acidobacteriota bacterium]
GAKRAFEDCLAQLRKDPKNADLKRETVHLGQCYSRLSIGRDGRPAFDEAALNKAVATVCPPELYPPPAEDSLEFRLEQLDRYRRRGLITEPEYKQKRAELLAGSPPAVDRWGQKLDHN